MGAAPVARVPALIMAVALCGLSGAVSASSPVLDGQQTSIFRSWFVRIVAEQYRMGPTPRWTHRDCAGLVRFAAYEALKPHDGAWLRASGITNEFLPPEMGLRDEQTLLLNNWKQVDGHRGPYVSALALIQENSHFVSRDINQAEPADLLFFDQGDDQHLMIWMGSFLVYHTGTVTPQDNGLRKQSLKNLMEWSDTRWQPRSDNPNFIGIYRLSFLSR